LFSTSTGPVRALVPTLALRDEHREAHLGVARDEVVGVLVRAVLEAPMISLRGLPMRSAADVLAYVRQLPNE
jgi:hypothetical protein